MIEAILIGSAVGMIAFLAFRMLFPGTLDSAHTEHTRHALRALMEETQTVERETATGGASILKSNLEDSPVLLALSSLPGGFSLVTLILKAGYGHAPGGILLACLALLAVFFIVASWFQLGWFVYALAILLAVYLPIYYLQRRIRKRNETFLNQFPDVLDMIVRSVRSGFPLHTAMKMVADNMDPPVKTEFKQVSDEIALGRPLDDALGRLAARIDEPDIHFFVVVLNVQHETGGNLAEVLSNLANIIRKRKQLRLKIKAMTSEGRATGWVLGSLPVVVYALLSIIAPKHLEPLYDSTAGLMILATAFGLIAITMWIIKQMVDIEI